MSLFYLFVAHGGRKRGNRWTDGQTDRDYTKYSALGRRGLIMFLAVPPPLSGVILMCILSLDTECQLYLLKNKSKLVVLLVLFLWCLLAEIYLELP